jgi:hypothetical protein
MRTVLLFTLLSLVALTGPARADRKFHGVPAAKGVQLRVVEYDGATNGALTVELRNRGKKAVSFTAQGLYFVPDGDPDKAPQRLGAVGPFQVEGEEDRRDALEIAAGETVTVTLDVFCIDSHRGSPDSETPFTVAKKRMPKALARDIDRGAREAADEEGGFAAPAAKAKVQGAVWKNRDKKWVKLDGEGDQEADK